MYYALTMTHKIGQIDGFPTEAEIDEFTFDMTTFDEEEKRIRAEEGNDYGPPVVLAFVADDLDAVFKNNFEYPFAVYLRGERYDCTRRKE